MRSAVLLVAALLAAFALGADALYGPNSDVITLTGANFKDTVRGSPRLFVVEFFAPWCGHCQKLKPDYEKAATNLKGLVNVGAVDCDAEANRPICSQYGIQGFPTIKIFEPGKSTPTDYQGARSARDIVNAATEKMPSKVTKVASASVDKFLEGSPDRAHFLLFTSKSTTAPMFKAFSVDFADVALLGEAKSTDKDLASKYSVTAFPTLLAFPVGASEPVLHSGANSQEELRAFFVKHSPARKASTPPPAQETPEEPEYVEPVWLPEVPEVRSQAQFKEECLDKRIGVCLIAFLDTQEDVTPFVKILEALKLKAHQEGSAFHFLWVNGVEQSALRTAFDISDQLPGALLISPNKGRFRPFLGAFDERGLGDFLSETASGRGRTFKNPVAPVIA